jgi:hypothetical protein
MLFILGAVIFTLLLLVSILVTYYVTVLLNQHDEKQALDPVIMLQMTVLVSYVTDLITETSAAATGYVIATAADSVKNIKKIVQVVVIVTVLLTISSNIPKILDILDTTWRCVLFPLFQDFIMTLGQIIRLIYDAVIPLYNYYVVVTKQATSGSIALAVKCDLKATVVSIKLMLNIFISMFSSVFEWSGTNDMTADNNIFVNDINTTQIFSDTQDFIAHQEQTLSCICDGLEDVFSITFEVVKEKSIAKALNHGVNVPLSIVQTFVGILPVIGPRFPDFKNTVYHVNGLIYHTSRYIDIVLVKILQKIIRLFNDDFHLEGVPKDAIFTSMGYFAAAGVHALHTVVRTTLHILIPVPKFITSAHHMMKAMQFNEAARAFNQGIYGVANNMYWMLEVQDKLMIAVKETVINGKVELPGMVEHTLMSCDAHTLHDTWTLKTSCALYLTLQLPLNAFYITTNLLTELLWKSGFNQQQSFIRTLQRYDGPTYAKAIAPSCAYRDSIKWDLTSGTCSCTPPDTYPVTQYNIQHPFGVPHYDVWCNQPTLAANIFGNVERAVLYAAGIGMVQIMKDFTTTNVLIINELYKTAIKVILNLPDIVSGQFFHYKINCVYGVSETQLEQNWLDSGKLILPCDTPKDGYMKRYDGFIYTMATGKYAHTYRYCTPIHDHIRFHACNSSKYNIQTSNSPETQICSTENKEGCECNIALPLSDTNLCKCIFKFPDKEQTVVQGAFQNTLLDKLYEHSHHWCNTYMFEGIFYYVDRYAVIVDRFLGNFHPAYNTVDNAYCTAESYELLGTDILHYSYDQYSESADIYNALAVNYKSDTCTLFASYDIICSASMSVRSGVRLVISGVRGIIMSIFHLLASSGTTVDISTRLCDLQRTAAGVASTLSDTINILVANKNIKKGMTKILFALIDAPIEILNGVNVLFMFLVDTISGNAGFQQSATQPVFDLIIKELGIAINWVKMLNNAFATYFNAIKQGAGKFFETLNTIIDILHNFLNDAIIEMLMLIFKTTLGFIEMIVGGKAPETFFTDLWTLITKAIGVLLQNAGKLVDALLEMLGPVGTFIKSFSATVCNTIQEVLCALTFGDECDMKCSGGKPSSFSPEVAAVIDDVGQGFVDIGDGLVGLFGRRLHSSLHNLPNIVASHMKWDGDSECDILIRSLRHTNFTHLRILEKTKFVACIEQRAIAVKFAKQIGLPLPHSILYNWKTKWSMLRKFFTSAKIYFTSNDIMQDMRTQIDDYMLYIMIWKNMKSSFKRVASFANINRFVHTVFNSFHQNISNLDTSMGNIYRIYTHSAVALKNISSVSTTLVQDAHVVKYHFKKHVTLGTHFKGFGTRDFTFKDFGTLDYKLKNFGTRIFERSGSKTSSQLYARNFVLKAAGIRSDVGAACENAQFCLNCAVIDNFITTTVEEGKRMAGYYEHTFAPIVVPSFVTYFQQQGVASKAWREDMGSLLQKAAEDAAQDVEDAVDTTILNARPHIQQTEHAYKFKLKFTANQTKISHWRRAVKDWEYLYQNWKLRDQQSGLKILEMFFTVTDDTYVPLFAHSVSWFVTYPFAGECPMSIIYTEDSTITQRMDRITDAIVYMLYFTAAIYLFQFFTDIPIPTFITPVLPFCYAAIYMLAVYSYTLPCYPNIPNAMLDDALAYINDRLFPDCLCYYLPGISTCEAETCFICSLNTQFLNCYDEIPFMQDMGTLWAPAFYMRKYYPGLFTTLYTHAPSSWIMGTSDGIVHMANQINDRIDITPVEKDCFNLYYGDNILAIVFTYVALSMLSIVVPVALRITSSISKIITMLFGILYSMTLALELSSTNGLKNTYQHQ